jgi:hypothetical protein
MGDRAQVKLVDEGRKGEAVYLYTHWGGDALVDNLHEAMAKRWRWGDCEYLARIIFDVMTRGHEGTETGFGIGTTMHGDLNHPLITVDCKRRQVVIGGMVASFDHFITDFGRMDAREEYRK